MSKKVAFRLESGEAALVGKIEWLSHLASTCEGLAELYPKHRESWLDFRDWINEWVEKTAHEE